MDLSNLTKPQSKPPMITLVGMPGVGKTSLAALFPDPVIVQAEKVGAVFDDWSEDDKPMVFPALPRADSKTKASTIDSMLDQLRALATQEHTYKTAVIDSVTSLHTMFEHEVCVQSNVDNIGEAAGSYGKGYLVVKEMHGEVMAACEYLREKKGMAIVFLAHAGIKKMKNRPDADEYTIFSLDMHEASIPVYTNLVDGVFYLRMDEYIKGTQTDKKGQTTKFGKVVQTGDRILVTSGNGKIGFANAKSRWNIDAEIPVPKGENPLLGLISYYKNERNKTS